MRERVLRPEGEAMGVDIADGERGDGTPGGIDVPLRLALALGLVPQPPGERHPAQVQDAHRKVTVGRAERGRRHGHDRPVDDDQAALDVPEVEVGARPVPGTERLREGVGLLLDDPPLTRHRELRHVHPPVPRGKPVDRAVHVREHGPRLPASSRCARMWWRCAAGRAAA
jgi:hypothetical protein